MRHPVRAGPGRCHDLVVALLSAWGDDSEVVRTSVQRSLMLRIKDYIDRRLADPTLGPAEIAAAVNISTRYLHRLFAAEDRSVGQYVPGVAAAAVPARPVGPAVG